jgi:hypothetical protein
MNRPKLESDVSQTQVTPTPFCVRVWMYKQTHEQLTTHTYKLQLTINITTTKYFDWYVLPFSGSRRRTQWGEQCVSDTRMWGKGPVADSNLVDRHGSMVTCDPSKGQDCGYGENGNRQSVKMWK